MNKDGNAILMDGVYSINGIARQIRNVQQPVISHRDIDQRHGDGGLLSGKSHIRNAPAGILIEGPQRVDVGDVQDIVDQGHAFRRMERRIVLAAVNEFESDDLRIAV